VNRNKCPGVTGSDTTSVIAQRDADHYEQIAEVLDSAPTLRFTYLRSIGSISPSQERQAGHKVSGKGKPDAKLALQIYQVQ
jgi:hypothetical protein